MDAYGARAPDGPTLARGARGNSAEWRRRIGLYSVSADMLHAVHPVIMMRGLLARFGKPPLGAQFLLELRLAAGLVLEKTLGLARCTVGERG